MYNFSYRKPMQVGYIFGIRSHTREENDLRQISGRLAAIVRIRRGGARVASSNYRLAWFLPHSSRFYCRYWIFSFSFSSSTSLFFFLKLFHSFIFLVVFPVLFLSILHSLSFKAFFRICNGWLMSRPQAVPSVFLTIFYVLFGINYNTESNCLGIAGIAVLSNLVDKYIQQSGSLGEPNVLPVDCGPYRGYRRATSGW